MICTTRYTLLVLSKQENEIGCACGSVGEKKSYRDFEGKCEWAKPLGNPSYRRGDNIKTHPNEVMEASGSLPYKCIYNNNIQILHALC